MRTTSNQLFFGYLSVPGMLDGASVALLDLEGRILNVPLATVRWVALVRDFNLNDREDPERLTRRIFLARPRSEGLWARLTMHGGEVLEGLAPLDVTLLDNLLDDRGMYLIPPDVRSNTQRLYVPRAAILGLQIVAVITTPSKSKTTSEPGPQESLFPEPS